MGGGGIPEAGRLPFNQSQLLGIKGLTKHFGLIFCLNILLWSSLSVLITQSTNFGLSLKSFLICPILYDLSKNAQRFVKLIN